MVVKIVLSLWQDTQAFRAYPGLMFSALLLAFAAQFLLMGLLGELVIRTYHGAQGKKIYAVRRIIEHDGADADRA